MPRKRTLGLAAAALSISLFSACSAEALTERAIALGIEQAAEQSGEEIDLDFSFDDDGQGGFSISTDEGDFAFNLDGDNGGIVFDTEDGAGSISFDEDGIVFDTEDGDGVINFEEDGITFDTDAGDGSISIDEDGIVFETDEGDGVISFDEDGARLDSDFGNGSISASQDAPAIWPSQIGVPATADPSATTYGVLETPDGVTVTAQFVHAAGDTFGTDVQERLQALGYSTMFSSSEGGEIFAQFIHGNDLALVTSAGTTSSVIITFGN